MGGGVFELGNPEGRGAEAVLEIQVDGGGDQKTVPSVVGVWIFSGITHSHKLCGMCTGVVQCWKFTEKHTIEMCDL